MAMVIPLYSDGGVQVGTHEVHCNCVDVASSYDSMFAVYLRVILNNIRSFSACAKTRGEVTCSNKKPWKQKGTGRARVGAASSPLWRKGGVIFGPRPGGKQLSVNKSLAKKVFMGMFAQLLSAGKVKCLDIVDDSFTVSTAGAVKILKSMLGQDFLSKRVVLFLTDQSFNVARSFRILENVVIELYGRQDIRSLATADVVLFLKEDKNLFEKLVVGEDGIN